MQTRATALYPFVPSGPDYAAALRFFQAIGFVREWGDDSLSGLRFGGAFFFLQNIHNQTWQENQMLTLEVDDLDRYWQELAALDLPATFNGVAIKPPTVFPWGREINLIDPAGVCWHIRQKP